MKKAVQKISQRLFGTGKKLKNKIKLL